MKKFYYKTILSEKYSFNGWEIFNSGFENLMIKENKAMLLFVSGVLFNMCCRCNVCVRSDKHPTV